VEWELGALAEGADQHQHEHQRIPGVRAQKLARLEDPIEVVASDDFSDQQHAREQAQAAGRRNRQRHAGAAARFRAVIPVRDQHERGEAGELPEHHHLNEISGQNDAQHRAHEREQEREKARHRIGGREVVARVEDDQRSDAGDQHSEDERKAVETQLEVESDLWQPGNAGAHDTAALDAGLKDHEECRAGECKQSREPGACVARVRRQHRGTEAADERQEQDESQDHAVILAVR
jgi:hypothetical protein